jgi:hypothetical protein
MRARPTLPVGRTAQGTDRESPETNSTPGAGCEKVRLDDANPMMTRRTHKLVREGRYAAEVPVELIEDETVWSPYLSPADTSKLDAVRWALRSGDVAAAAKHGRVFELHPVSV